MKNSPCERFHVYLYGTDFDFLTDHGPLEDIFAPRGGGGGGGGGVWWCDGAG